MNNDKNKKKKIAIIGSGVSGLTCAHYLVSEHDVTIFEANDYLGGHVNTIDVTLKTANRLEKDHIEKSAIDTGFIVFNERTYPNFFRLLNELNVPFQKTDMSFSVKNPSINFEYNGHTLNSLLSQRKNVLNPEFWQFATDIIRFNRHIKQLRQAYLSLEAEVQNLSAKINGITSKRKIKKLTKQLTNKQALLTTQRSKTLGDYLSKQKYGKLFEDNYLLPMVSAIWSMGLDDSKAFPLIFFAQFFENHGLLDIVNRPQWFTIQGGSKQYVNKLVSRYAKLGGKALLNSPVLAVQRHCQQSSFAAHNSKCESNVSIIYQDANKSQKTAYFDDVIFACHADVAKRLLSDITTKESQILGKFDFTDNEAILHTDTTALPNKHLAWASWNYLLPNKGDNNHKTKSIQGKDLPVLTYHMNILQRLVKKHNYLVTLNEPVNEAQVIKRINYRHPVYNIEMTQAQKQWHTLTNENNHTYFCGAYWFNGFHEDGVKSGVRVCETFKANVAMLDKVNPTHLTKVSKPHPVFSYNQIPINADKNARKLAKLEVISATTNTELNELFL